MTLMSRRVEKGAAYLDVKRPGWHEEINTATLEMDSPHNCILGQLYEDYSYGIHRIRLHSVSKAAKHGFVLTYWQNLTDKSTKRNNEKLKAEWINVIQSRKSG